LQFLLLQDELVWDLRLGELWQHQNQLVQKLICCSKSMIKLVPPAVTASVKVGATANNITAAQRSLL
jgi:hypothetical protein